MSEYHKVGEVEVYLMTELDCGPNCWTGLRTELLDWIVDQTAGMDLIVHAT